MTLDHRDHALRGVRCWVVDLFPEFSGLPEHRFGLLGVCECLTPSFGEFVVDQFELPACQLTPRGGIWVVGDVTG